MARFQTSALMPGALLLILFLQTVSQVGSTPQLFGTGQQICNYQYAVPYGGDCVTYMPALEQKVDAVQRDVDRVKLRFVTDTSVLREELSKLSQQSSGTDTRLQELGSGLRAVQAALAGIQAAPAASSSSSSRGSAETSGTALAMLEQLVKTTQAKLTQDMLRLENQLHQMQSGLQAEIMGNGVQESKVDQALQAQLRQHETDLTTVMKQMQLLDQRVNSLERVTHSPAATTTPTTGPTHAPSTTTTTTTTTPATTTTTSTPLPATTSTITGGTTLSSLQVQQLEKDLKSLDSRLTLLESDYNVDVPQLKSNITYLAHLTANHSLDLSNMKVEVESLDTQKLPQLEQQATITYQALIDLKHKYDQEFGPLVSQVQTLAGNISSIGPQLTTLATKIITEVMDVRSLNHTQHDLTNRLTALEAELQRNGISTPAATTTKLPVPTPRGTPLVPPRRTTTTRSSG